MTQNHERKSGTSKVQGYGLRCTIKEKRNDMKIYRGREIETEQLVMRLLNNSDSFIFAKGCLPGSLDLGQDLLSFSPPDVPLGFEVMPGEVLHDGIDQLAHAAEAAGQDRL